MAVPVFSRFAITLTLVVLIVSFQQCAPLKSITSGKDQESSTSPTQFSKPTCERSDNPSSAFVCPSAEQRLASFAASPRGWDFEWDGSSTPADSSRFYQTWFDNPYDDDIREYKNGPAGVCLIHFDSSPGIVSLDKHFYTDANGVKRPCPQKTGKGWFMRRDPLLDTTAGLTFEIRMRLPDYGLAEQKDSVRFYFTGRSGRLSVLFTPGVNGCVKISNPGVSGAPTECVSNGAFKAIPWNTSQWTIYRMTLDPGTGLGYSIRMTPNSRITSSNPETTGLANNLSTSNYYPPGTAIPVQDDRYEFPHFTFGAHESGVGAYDLDYIRYTRGPVLPDEEPIQHALYPPAIPANLPVGDHAGAIKDVLLTENKAFTVNKPAGLLGNGDWTIEMRAKAGANLSDRGFALEIWERMGMVTLVLSKDRVELSMGAKFLSFSKPVYLDTAQETTYRLVKYGHLPFIYLYINDEPRPVLADFMMSAVSMNSPNELTSEGAPIAGWEQNEMRLRYGWLSQRMPNPSEYGPAPEYKPFNNVDSVMDIDIQHIRWNNMAVSGRSY